MDAAQFESIYRSEYAALRQAARNLLRDADAAHDVVQEVFLRLWHKRGELHAILNPSAYLYKSVVNASLNFLEQKKKRRSAGENHNLPAAERSDGPVELREMQQQVAAAIEKLPPKCRAIFVLSRYEQRKNREIADLLDISLKTVENQMGIALKKLREDLGPFLGADARLATGAGVLFMIASWFSIN